MDTADSMAGDREAVDPDLLEMPAPPNGRRVATLALMALVVVASMALAISLRHDLAYFFAPSTTVDLGDVRSIDPVRLQPNSYVRVEGTPMMSRAARYRRVLTGGDYVVFPLAGQRLVYVQVEDAPDAMARTQFSGRLVTFSQLGSRIGAVQSYLGEDMNQRVSGESFLILADESPGTYGWALLLAGLCVVFVLLNLFLILRWFRPIDRRSSAEPTAAAS